MAIIDDTDLWVSTPFAEKFTVGESFEKHLFSILYSVTPLDCFTAHQGLTPCKCISLKIFFAAESKDGFVKAQKKLLLYVVRRRQSLHKKEWN